MADPQIKRFRGLNNVSDPLRLGLGWLARADNVVVTDSGALERRNGYGLALTQTMNTGAFSTFDYQRAYLVDNGVLSALNADLTTTPLVAGLQPAQMFWAEINDQVFYNNGTDAGIIQPDNTVLSWRWDTPLTPVLAAVTGSLAPGLYRACAVSVLPDGRTTGSSELAELTVEEGQALSVSGFTPGARIYIAPANNTAFGFAGARNGAFVWDASPDQLGRELQTATLNPLPIGADVITAWRGRIYAAQALPGMTAVWISQPLAFHLFDLAKDVVLVPGKVLMLAAHDDALIIGTAERIYAYDGAKLVELAPYGVVPGWHTAKDDDGKFLFWTTRGLCSALPFSNLTDRQVSVAPGIQAGATIVRSGGQKRYLVALQQGGDAFNSYL